MKFFSLMKCIIIKLMKELLNEIDGNDILIGVRLQTNLDNFY